MYKAVIFDFFDVIHGDPLSIMLESKGLKREGPFAEICKRLDLGGIDYQGYMGSLAEAFGLTKEQFDKEFENSASLDVEVIEIIQKLRHQRYQTILLSNTHRDEIQPLLDRHSLHRLFDDVIISAEVGMSKPDPQIFRFTTKRIRLHPKQTVFTDDNPKNVTAANSVGIHGLHFTSASKLRNDLSTLGLTI